MKLAQFEQIMKQELDIERFCGADSSQNGVQVGNLDADVRKVAFAVDASLATINAAAEQGADVLFVHHGMFWNRSLTVTGRHYNRVKALLDNDIALFGCHLPLDAHLVYGNNAQMAKKLELQDIQPFGLYHGVYVGVKGEFQTPLDSKQIIGKLQVRENDTNFELNCEGRTFRTVAIVSGGGANDVYAAMDENLDLLITGESSYTTINDCNEGNMSMLCLGHYETETFGVKAVMEMVKSELGLEACFIDIPLGL
ncbi:MAG: Nif3-like dinuclear metal center hexameric protein [Spirochaetales bacterium]|nr:Nif3-like dinuclear metal center hexameric protein [Spirochaetales bacterium]